MMKLITSKDSCILDEKSANYICIHDITCNVDIHVLSAEMGIKEVTFNHMFSDVVETTEGAVTDQYQEKEGETSIGDDESVPKDKSCNHGVNTLPSCEVIFTLVYTNSPRLCGFYLH